MILARYGDIKFLTSMDPLMISGLDGGKINIRSIPGQKLTYGIARVTMQGLINVLVTDLQGREADVEIEEVGVGTVGVCNVTAVDPVPNRIDNVSIA